MRTLKLTAVCAALTLAAIAAEMSGDFNSWLGYLAGYNADGERSTVQGAGAGGEAGGIVRTDFVGAAAGAFSSNMADCVGIGYRALRDANGMSNVVAIGAGALSNRTGLVNATWINGQFYASAQGNTFWIKSNPDTPDTNAPICYADGVLNLNATVRLNGGEISGGGSGGGESGPTLLGYDLYVDPVNGDDIYAGTSPGTAKRTLEAALALPGTNICLMAGEHAGHTNSELSIARRFYAPYGKAKTTIKGSPNSLYGLQVAYIENCTMVDLLATVNTYPSFSGVASNCVIRYMVNKTTCAGISGATFYDCDVYGVWAQAGNQSSRGMLVQVEAYNSRLHFSSSSNTTISVHSLYNSTLEDCVLIATNVGKFVYSGAMTFRNCTVLCPTATEWGSATAYNSIFGCGDGANIWNPGGTNNICGAYSEILPLLDTDYRPAVTNWRYRYTGYKSGPERAVRDSMLESIRAALEAAAN